MSLHIGNLSSCICRDDLERVFRRFGRCSIMVKDKYGFAVFNYPASAEKALKALRGTRICGEELTLSWSKHQPHAPQRFTAGGKLYKQPYRKYSAKENAGQMLGSSDQRDFGVDFKNVGEGRAIGFSDLHDESTSYHPDDVQRYVGERDHAYLNDYHGLGGAGKNYLEDDRWEEPIVDPSNESYLENGIEFDRYEPGHSVGIKEFDEHQTTSPLASSPSRRKSKERAANIYHRKSQKNCYLCGEVGHKMRYCPLELKRQVPRSHGRMGPRGGNVPLRYQESERSQSTLENRRRLLRRGDSSHLHITPNDRKKELRNKQGRRNYENTDKNDLERADGSSSPSIRSGYTSSRSRSPSRSLRSLSQPPSPSKPPENSPSSSLKSSPSHHSGSKTLKSQSTSLSMSPVSFDLNRQLSPPSNKIQTESKDSVPNADGLSHHTDLFEDETLVRSGTGTSKSENITCEVGNECGTIKDLFEKDNDRCHNVSKDSCELFESYGHQSHADDHFGKNMLRHHVSEKRNSKGEYAGGAHKLTFESDMPARSDSSNLERMSSEEVCMVLKHYDLKYPVENEKDVPVESYFGSARLWPWEIIYYRRLKKGSISAENYSRRIAQNEEFGIVDKYVRCSSGWGQLK